MSNKVERVAASLFSDEAIEIVDVKFFGGTRANVTADELAGQVDRVKAQLGAGTVERSSVLESETSIALLAS